ncbi:MAG: tRNA cyclic N6-threonylcarbamoyladenosine(37) synthase TcdA [Proteobacteria bacterium]|nr:MAG: tRNA cyclic N6-threonylcarbamoyladenosine(37) synthase TcdA [Pseudomonadota bacterium]
MDKFERVRAIFGNDFEKLRQAKVLLLGVGGVGGFCLDGLYRSGVEDITMVDFDSFELTNQNRQIGSEAVGEIKVKKLHQIYPKTTPIQAKIDENWVTSMNFAKFDLVIDAIDDMDAKITLALNVSTPFISSMGGAKKIDPTYIKYDSIWNTKGDPLAKAFRQRLRKAGFSGDFEVVYSDEISKCQGMGSFVGVTGSFGLALCALAVRKILEK